MEVYSRPYDRKYPQVCLDEKRTDGNIGQLMPIIIDAPVSGQFAVTYTVDQVDEDGDKVPTNMHKWEYKGWRLPSEAQGVKPAESLVKALADQCLDELQRSLKEDKVKPTDAQDELDALRVMIYRANGLEDPAAPKAVQIRNERKAKRTRAKGAK